jgi:hypothetical protein
MIEDRTGDDGRQDARAERKPYVPPRLHQLDDKDTEGKATYQPVELLAYGPS